MDFYQDTIKTFIIDENAIIETKSKDPLVIKYAGLDLSHFAVQYSNVHCFQVDNQKNGNKYTVKFWKSPDDLLITSCDCIAKLRCKHIVRSYEQYKNAIEIGFISG